MNTQQMIEVLQKQGYGIHKQDPMAEPELLSVEDEEKFKSILKPHVQDS